LKLTHRLYKWLGIKTEDNRDIDPLVKEGKITYRVELFETKKGHYWRLVSASNGKKLAVSEKYETAAMRNKTAARLYKNLNKGTPTHIRTV